MKKFNYGIIMVAVIAGLCFPQFVESRIRPICEHQLCFWNTGKCIGAKESYWLQCDGDNDDCTGESSCPVPE